MEPPELYYMHYLFAKFQNYTHNVDLSYINRLPWHALPSQHDFVRTNQESNYLKTHIVHKEYIIINKPTNIYNNNSVQSLNQFKRKDAKSHTDQMRGSPFIGLIVNNK